jgi:hypothetical protein
MFTQTQNRLLALALLSASAALLAQSNENGAPPRRLPDGNNMGDHRMDRQPYVRPVPGTNGIPDIAPTTAPVPQPAPAQDPAPAQPAQTYAPLPTTPARRATVSYTAGQLAVVAANSSLNQILRDISHSANIKITGGVAEERVFGNYGPGTPLEVLTSLLDGTGSNMFLVQGSAGHASELVLTTRTGGPTPPNPNASRFDAQDDQPAPPIAPPPGPQSEPVRDSNSNASAPPPPPPPAGTNSNATPASSSTSSDSSTSGSGDSSTNGAKTPQQIFDELMKLRQQNQSH